MTLDPDLCYRALRSRDPRFDGRFFTGVLSTGVYCRPVCPARTPGRDRVRFFPCAAAAEQAGFRPCRRCRPDTAPGSPPWRGTSTTVSRALRLVVEGALDGASIDALADRVGVGARHLRRLFVEQLGASPVAIARTRRLHFARQLVDQTTLPMGEIALAAEFPSVRRFNAAFRRAFGRTPTEARRQAPGRTLAPAMPAIHLLLPYRPPLNWRATLTLVAAHVTPGVEEVAAGVYRRTVASGSSLGWIEVRQVRGRHALELRAHAPAALLSDTVARTRRMFDLDADPTTISRHLARDAWLAPRIRRLAGLRLPGAWDAFEATLLSALAVTSSLEAARDVMGRLARAFGRPAPTGAEPLDRCFPDPHTLAGADLGAASLSRSDADVIARIAGLFDRRLTARTTAGGQENVAALVVAALGDAGEAHQHVAMRLLGDTDAWPAVVLGDRPAGRWPDHRVAKEQPRPGDVEAWRPWRAYAQAALFYNRLNERPTSDR